MMRNRLIVSMLVLSVSAGVYAQERAPDKPALEPRDEAAPSAPVPVRENVRIDLTITDQSEGGQPFKRTVTMIVADRQNGRIRTTANRVDARLHVDATPHILPGGEIQLLLALDYNPRQADSEEGPPPGTVQLPAAMHPTGGSNLHQRMTVLLHPGKPLVISQSADPLSDRRVSVEARATILK